MEQYREIPYFLRDFVEHYRDSCGDAYRRAYHKTHAQDYAVNKIMHAVRKKHQSAHRMDTLFSFIFAVVVPMKKFFQNKKDKHADDYQHTSQSTADFAL